MGNSSNDFTFADIANHWKISLGKGYIKSMTGFRLNFMLFGLIAIQSVAFAQTEMTNKQIGLNFLRKGEYISALENLNIAIRLEPSVPELYYIRGYTKYCLDDFLGAERDYSISIGLSPFLADVFINRAVVRSQQQNYKGAFEDFSIAIEMDSTNAEIYFNRARTFLFLKKYYACLMDCNKAIQINNKLEGVYVVKGSAEIGLERYDNAISNLTTAIEINPLNPFNYTQRGLVWLEKTQADSAIIDFSRAIQVDSNNSYAYFNRALARSKKSDEAGALEDLNKVILLSPYNSYAYFNRAITLIGLNNKKGAIRDFEYVSKLDPENIISYYYRGRLKADILDYKGALQDLDKTIELFPDYADAYYERYSIKNKMRDYKGAQEDYKRALELGEKNRLTPDSLKYRKENYLQKLVKLSGDFEERNTLNSKFQNQYLEIELLPMFNVFLGKASLDKIRLYDVFPNKNYFSNIITLTNNKEIWNDSLCSKEIIALTRIIDSLPDNPEFYFNRGVYFSAVEKNHQAIQDFVKAIDLDSNYIPVNFCLANARFEILEHLQSEENSPEEITIMLKNAGSKEHERVIANMGVYRDILRGYDKAIALDSGFSYAYYNRGYLNARLGHYKEAISDFSNAIQHKPDFSEAYYNRGLLFILLKEPQNGCEDLSHAGEYGILEAYKVMKRYCYK